MGEAGEEEHPALIREGGEMGRGFLSTRSEEDSASQSSSGKQDDVPAPLASRLQQEQIAKLHAEMDRLESALASPRPPPPPPPPPSRAQLPPTPPEHRVSRSPPRSTPDVATSSLGLGGNFPPEADDDEDDEGDEAVRAIERKYLAKLGLSNNNNNRASR